MNTDSAYTPADAIETLSKAFAADSHYGWTWHCNIAMVAYDCGVDLKEANNSAATFMKNAFGFDSRKCDEWKREYHGE